MWAYPGTGRALNLATYATGKTSQVTYPLTPVIPDEALSDSEAISDAMKVDLNITYDSAPTAATTVQFATEPTFTNAITLATLPLLATDKINVLQITEPLNGFIRVYNTSDVTIDSIFVNKQVSTTF